MKLVRFFSFSILYLDIFLFQYFSAGSRFGDVLKMKWADIEDEGKILRRIEEKTGKDRRIPINQAMKWIFDKYAEKSDKKGYVFPLKHPSLGTIHNKEWNDYKYNMISKVNSSLKTIKNNLNLKVHLSTHVSRHTFATHTFNVTKDIKTTSNIIGHSSMSTTEKYVHEQGDTYENMIGEVYKDQIKIFKRNALNHLICL